MRTFLKVVVFLGSIVGLSAADIPADFLGIWQAKGNDTIFAISKDGYSADTCSPAGGGYYGASNVKVKNAKSFCADFRRSPDDPSNVECWSISGARLKVPSVGQFVKVGSPGENYDEVKGRVCK